MPFILALLFFASSALAAPQVYVASPSSDSAINAGTVKALVTASVTKLGGRIVSDPGTADFELQPSVLQLGSAYLVTIARFDKGQPGAVEKAKARQVEELDEVIHRVVRAVMQGRNVAADARPSDVMMDEEQTEVRRKSSRSGSIVAAGPGVVGNLSSPGVFYYLSLGKGWGIGPLRLGWHGDFALRPSPDLSFFADVNFNMAYFFMDRDFSPFLSGEFGFGLVRDGSTGNAFSGLQTGGTVGVAFFRTYDIHVEVGLQGSIIFAAGSPRGNPALGALRIGASF